MTARQTMTETVKKAIRASGYSQKRLAQKAGLSQAAISLILSGRRGLTLESAEKIGRVIGLEITPTKPKGRNARRRYG